MAKQVQLRRGNNNQHSTFTGAEGEVTYNTQTKTLIAHDGATVGGNPLPTRAEVFAASIALGL
jgi:hypothetical protein